MLKTEDVLEEFGGAKAQLFVHKNSGAELLSVESTDDNKVFGVTCHNSKNLCKRAVRYNANYVALGSFFKSKLKPKAKLSNINTLKWAKKKIKCSYSSNWWNY